MEMLQGYKTFLGIALTVLPIIVQLFGYHLVPGASDAIGAEVDQIVQIIGAVIASYGRLKASTPGYLVKTPKV